MSDSISYIAGLLADESRSKILLALMNGKALTATELSISADITPQTTSSHLKKLVDGKLLVVRTQGRHRYFQLRDSQIAEIIEGLLCQSSLSITKTVETGPVNSELRIARICYDHMAGEVATALFESLLKNKYIREQYSQTEITSRGKERFAHLGVDFEELSESRRPLCRSCLDWSERKSHLAGALGNWILDDIISAKMAVRDSDSRALIFSPQGLKYFRERYETALPSYEKLSW